MKKLDFKEVRKNLDLSWLVVEKDYRLDFPIEMVGQDRVLQALELALEKESKFHVILVAEDLSLQSVEEYIKKKIGERRARGEKFEINDYCYVYNFENPERPKVLIFAQGEGKEFKNLVGRIEERLKLEIPEILESEEFQSEVEKLRRIFQKRERAALREYFDELERRGIPQKLKDLYGWGLEFSEGVGIIFGPIVEGRVISPLREIENLPPELKDKIDQVWEQSEELRQIFFEVNREAKRIILKEKERLEGAIKNLKRAYCEEVVNSIFDDCLPHYKHHPRAQQFLGGLRAFAKEKVELFQPRPVQQVMGPFGPMPIPLTESAEKMREREELAIPFNINLLVDNSQTTPPPILIESSPTYEDLFGKMERKLIAGFEVITDPTSIKAGAFHWANDGILCLDLDDILLSGKAEIFLALSRALRERKLEIRDFYEERGRSATGKTFNPEPIPLNLKIVLKASPRLYYSLWQYLDGKKLLENFQIKAEFDQTIELSKENVKAYSFWIDQYLSQKDLPSCLSPAKAKIIEFFLREAEDQERFAVKLGRIKALLKEAALYAKKESLSIDSNHVNKALEKRIYRSNLIEEWLQRRIEEKKTLIEIEGEKIGQINALTYLSLGDYRFGLPARITATTYQGKKGIINIEKEAELTEETQIKGVEILKGFFRERYGKKIFLNFEARIGFEDYYQEIGGPSASAAQLFCLISSLSQVPIKQNFALTGTIDQKGRIGAIGGVQEKIEGFFKICQKLGSVEGKGVLIPKANCKNLMLSEEVQAAVKEGKFNIFAIESYEEGIEILTGKKAREIDQIIKRTLKKWQESIKEEKLP